MGFDTKFTLDPQKCVGCGLCVKVCEGLMLTIGEDHKPHMADSEAWNGRGCWGCQHCLAVCPNGAISIWDKHPEDSLLPPGPEAADTLAALMVNRRSHRRYLDRNVDPQLVEKILRLISNLPTGGNRQALEYTVINDKEYLKQVMAICYKKMEELDQKGIYPFDTGKDFYDFLKKSEEDVRPNDLFLCSAPNLFIAHEEVPENSCWNHTKVFECGVASAYFDLLCAANGLGAVMLSYFVGFLNNAPELWELFGIPKNHCVAAVVGFGYPELHYSRGVQRENTCIIDMLSRDGLVRVSGRQGGHVAPNEHLDENPDAQFYRSQN